MAEAGERLGGSCLCGKLEVRITGQPRMTVSCHCLTCQKTSGAGHAFHLWFNAEQVEIRGEARGFKVTADSGNEVTTFFCPTCGSTTHGETAGFPGMITVRAAVLDQSDELKPRISVYKKRLRDWDSLAEGTRAFDAMPPMRAQPDK
jgi:hypothetical protein